MTGKMKDARRCSLLLCLVLALSSSVDGACLLPTSLTGTFVDSVKGSLTFSSSSTTTSFGTWAVYTYGSFTFECYLSSGSTYLLRSTTTFTYFGKQFRPYLCWQLSEISQYKFIYHHLAAQSSSAGNERVSFVLSGYDPTVTTTICTSTATTGTHSFLLASGSISSAAITCPSSIQGYYTYTINFGSGDTCASSSTYLDVCSDTRIMAFNYTLCSTAVGYSSTGNLYCLYEVAASTYTSYITLYNADTSTDESTTYRFTCLLVDYSKADVSATQYPQRCLSTQTTTTVSSPGAAIVGTLSSSCGTEEEVSTAWVTPVAIVCSLIFIAIIVISVLCIVRYYRDKKKQNSQVSDGRARDDRPEDVDTDPGTRGEGTPHVLMKLPKEEHFRKRSKQGKGKGTSKLETDVAPSTMQDGEEVVDLSKLVYISEDEGDEEDGPAVDKEKERKLPELGRESPDALALDKDNLIPGTNRDKLGFVRFKGAVRGKEKETRKKRQSKGKGSQTYEEEDEDTFYRRVGRKEFKDEEAITKPNKGKNYIMSKVKALANFRRKQTAGKMYETSRQQEKGEAGRNTPSGKGQTFEDAAKVDVSDRVAIIGEGDDIQGLLANTALTPNQAERGPGPGHSVDSQDGPYRQEGGGHETSRSMREHETVVVEDLEHNVAKTHVSGYVDMDGDHRPKSQPAGSAFRKKTPHGQDVTPNMRIRRQGSLAGEEEEVGAGPGGRPGTMGQGAPLANVSVLARLHRKRRVPLEEEVPEQARVGLAWRENMDDDQYYKLLEELYPDKKYMDYAKYTQEGTETECMDRLQDGLEFLHGRAVYWHENWPVVRPATGYDPSVADPSRPRSARTAMSQARRLHYTPSLHEPGPRPHTSASGGSGPQTPGQSIHKKRKSSARSARSATVEQQPMP